MFYDNSTILALTSNTSIFDTFATLAPNVGPTSNISILDKFATRTRQHLHGCHPGVPPMFNPSTNTAIWVASEAATRGVHGCGSDDMDEDIVANGDMCIAAC